MKLDACMPVFESAFVGGLKFSHSRNGTTYRDRGGWTIGLDESGVSRVHNQEGIFPFPHSYLSYICVSAFLSPFYKSSSLRFQTSEEPQSAP